MAYVKNKLYQKNKIKLILDKSKFLLLVNNTHKTAQMLNLIQQKLKPFYFTKLNNNILKKFFIIFPKIINNSLFLTNLIKNDEILTKSLIINVFSNLHIYVLSFKLNNNIYSTKKFTGLNSLCYYQNKKKLIQICLTNLKKVVFKFKKSK